MKFIGTTETAVAIGAALLYAVPLMSEGFEPAEIHVPVGFTVEVAAEPPLVKHPMFASFDDRGRLFVCESAGLNMSAEELETNLPNSIRLLEDADGDGKFDKSTLFADKMTFPQGGAWHDGALFVASSPNIWRLEDTDGDGVADKRDILVGKFGSTGNAADIHGCIPGPDGRLYWCDGYHGHEFKDQSGKVTSKREGSYMFSCWPDGSDVRIHCGGGMDNPVEIDFTNEGEMLGTVNIFYTGPRVDCFVHWLYGGAYPHREQVLAELKVTGEVLGPVHRFGHVAVSGTTCYRSGALDHGWQDNFFATYFNSGKVVRLELEPHDATFSVTQREFLSSTSHGCHLTDVAEDADGSLLVVDTGGWFYRGCPTSQFANPDIQGAIYRIRRKGMTQPVDPRGNHIDWLQQTSGQLVALLGDARFAVRERAIAECAKRGEAIAPELRQTLEHRDVGERLGAVWALTRIVGANHGTKSAAATTPSRAPGQAGPDESTAETAIRAALLDPHPSVRRAACRSIGTNPDAAALDRLLQIVQNDEPAIRREAATALGRIANAKAVPALLEGLSRDISRTEEHARIYALMEINDPAATAKGLSSPSVGVQRGALIALDQMDAGVLSPKVVTPLLDADDQSLRLAAFNVFRRRANDRRNHQASEGLVSTAQDSADSSYQDWIAHAVASLDRWLVSDATIRERADVVRGLLTTFIADVSVASVVGRVLRDAKTTPETRGLLLEAIAKGNSPPLHTSWTKPLEMLLDTSDERMLDQVLAAVSSIKTDHFNDKLHQIGMDESRPALVRIAAVEAGNASRTPSDAAFELLFELLAEDTPPAEKTRATQILAGLSPSTEQLVRLAESIQYAGPVELRNLVQPFVRSQEPEVARAFLDALESSQSFTVLEPHEFSDVIKGYPAELLPRANVLLDRLKELQQQKLARIDQLLPQLEAGNGARGREVFLAEKSQCSTCHRIAEEGGRVGPDLTTIGANRSGRDLLESIVFPSATIVRDFEPYTVVTTDGRVLAGLISRQTTDTLFLQQQTGDPIAIPQDDIEQIVPDVVSIMPAGLDQVLTEQQLADVIAYLMSLGRPAEGDAGGE